MRRRALYEAQARAEKRERAAKAVQASIALRGEEPVPLDRAALMNRCEIVFGKRPHNKTKTATLARRLQEAGDHIDEQPWPGSA